MRVKRHGGLYAAAYKLCSEFMGVKYDLSYSGADNIPSTGPALVLPKHQRMEDIVLEGIFFMKKLGRAANWVMKSGLPRALERLGGIAIGRPCDIHRISNREERRKSLEAARADNQSAREYVKWLYGMGEIVVVHPEGTRNPGKMGVVRKEFIDITRQAQDDYGVRIPVVPMGIEYTPEGGVFIRAGEQLDVSQPDLAEVVESEISRLSNII